MIPVLPQNTKDYLGNVLMQETVIEVFVRHVEAGVPSNGPDQRFVRAGYDKVIRANPDGTNPQTFYRPRNYTRPASVAQYFQPTTFEIQDVPAPRDPLAVWG